MNCCPLTKFGRRAGSLFSLLSHRVCWRNKYSRQTIWRFFLCTASFLTMWYNKQIKLLKRAVLYVVMSLSVFIIVTFIAFFVLGYRFDVDNGQIEQYAFLQFSSSPSGAVVKVDGGEVNSKTPNSTSVRAGQHNVSMQLDGYETWQKSVNLKSGIKECLNCRSSHPEKYKTLQRWGCRVCVESE